jgi:ABC-2 type transport system permease protein
VYALNEFYYALAILFGGLFVPLDLLPQFVQGIAQVLPFQLTLYFPIQLILGRLPADVIVLNFALGVIWLGVALVLFQLVWRAGVKRFSAVGA